jgi:DNA-binding transcriptional ArsR family regulator
VVGVNRRRADRVAGVLVVAVLLAGAALAWQAYQQQRALDEMGSMMGMSMGAVHGPNPLWYVLGTVLVAAVVVGLYLTVRDDLPTAETHVGPRDQQPQREQPRREQSRDGESRPAGRDPADATADTSRASGPINPEQQPRTRVLDLLPEDERRVLEPVLTSPGITQIELRDRSDFSKSKVSQTVSALEKRGLLYRERQGRTYRIYPSDELENNQG